MSKAFTALGVVAAGAAAAAVARARQLAEEEGRPLTQVLSELPGRLVSDVRTVPEDARRAAEDARVAAAQRQAEIDAEIERARQRPAGAGS